MLKNKYHFLANEIKKQKNPQIQPSLHISLGPKLCQAVWPSKLQKEELLV